MGLSYSKLDPTVVSDLTECTHFDKKEIISWHDNFVRQYPNGELTKQTLTASYLRYFPFGDPKPYVNLMFRLFQTKSADFIDFPVMYFY